VLQHHILPFTPIDEAQLTADMLRRKSSWLSNEDWLKTPWSRAPKTARDEILDLMARVPSMFERLDQSLLCAPSLADLTAAVRDFRISYDLLQQDIDLWRRKVNSLSEIKIGEIAKTESVVAAATDADIPEELQCLCSTMEFFVHRELSTLCGQLARSERIVRWQADITPQARNPTRMGGTGSTDKSEVYWASRTNEDVDMVVQCVEWCLDAKLGVLTSTRLIFPTLMVAETLQSREDGKLQHILESFRQYQQQTGSPVIDLLWDCASYLKCDAILQTCKLGTAAADYRTKSKTMTGTTAAKYSSGAITALRR
jgi:hypothetical protein